MKNYVIKAGRSFLITLMAILILMGIVFFFLHINHIPGFWETDEIIRSKQRALRKRILRISRIYKKT